ncbi:MAG: glycosyltransferase family 9 protein [Candidatus Aminicenantes bacterium]|nr:glycosyltransferase family 9 protein [Candidatus Aminicenantes bacterium]
MDNFLIIRLSSLGDIIHTLPAFAALRRNFPGAKIAWAVEPKGKDILDFVPGLNEIIVVGSDGWRKKLKNKDQTALDFQGLIKSGLIAFRSRARKRIGFDRKNLKEPLASLFYTDRIGEFPETDHVIRKNLALLTLLGIREGQIDFPLVVPEELRSSIREIIIRSGYRSDKKLALFNVGAAWETKRWNPEKWIEVLKDLKNEPIFPMLLWGTKPEKELALTVSEQTGIPLVPFLKAKEILALIKEAALLVSGDTFALHAACAFNVPVVGIFGPTNPARNGPFRGRDKVAYHELSCSLCYQRTCRSMECLEKITPEEVAFLVRQSLRANA